MRSRRATIGMVIVGLALLLLVGCTGGGGTLNYAVSGTITDVDGNGIKGVALSFYLFGTADTDEDGKWRKDGLSETVEVAPTKDGWVFEPSSRTVSKADFSVNFVATRLEYPLTIQVQGEGTVNQEVVVAAQGTEYEHGTQVQLTAVPATGWRFSHWEGDLEGNENLATIVVDGEKAVIAVFIRLVEAPSNLRGIIRGQPPRGGYREIQWDAVEHPHLAYYKVWIFDANFDKFVYLGRTVNEVTLYSDLQNITVGNPRRYKVSAVASYMGITLESELSEEITLTIGTRVPPLPPEWDPVDPIGTSGTEETVSLFLNWEPVVEREDGTAVEELLQYEVWTLIGEEFRRLSAVLPDETETVVEYSEYARGSNVSVALKAVDLWGNASELSEVKSIILGGSPNVND